jgi:hypothetical protein
MTWYTCTPVSFGGGEDFFCRDSGLICKGLQSLGLECKSIMPLPAHPEDITKDLIRTNPENLARSEWWYNIGASSVVLYSWGHPKYRQVAEAIHASGAKLFINLDSGGIISPRVTPELYKRAVMGKQIRLHGPLLGTLTGSILNIAYLFYIPNIIDPGRIAHLRAATAIGCISPNALALWRLWAGTYAPELVERMHLVPNPVAGYFKYDPSIPKQDIVIAIGRWEDEEVKRPRLLVESITETARRRSTTEFHIFGKEGHILLDWYSSLQSNIRKRVYLHGKVPNKDIFNFFQKSRISLCASSHEGSHVASEEALCTGATIVAPLRAELNALLWYVSHNSGRLAVEDSAQGLAEALLLELEAWDSGEHDPVSISTYWCNKLSVGAVSNRIIDLLK